MKSKSFDLQLLIEGVHTTVFFRPPNCFILESMSPNDLLTERPPGLILHGEIWEKFGFSCRNLPSCST